MIEEKIWEQVFSESYEILTNFFIIIKTNFF